MIKCEVDRRIGAVSAVTWTLYRTVVAERNAIYIQTLTYGSWALSLEERNGGSKLFVSSAGLSLKDRVKELEGEPLLLRVERSQLRWFTIWRLHVDVFWRHLTGRKPFTNQSTLKGLYIPSGLQTPQEEPEDKNSKTLSRKNFYFEDTKWWIILILWHLVCSV